jgi:hypothetical protein
MLSGSISLALVNPLKIYYPIKSFPMKAELLFAPKVIPGKFMVKLAFLGVFLMTCAYMFVKLLNTAINLL